MVLTDARILLAAWALHAVAPVRGAAPAPASPSRPGAAFERKIRRIGVLAGQFERKVRFDDQLIRPAIARRCGVISSFFTSGQKRSRWWHGQYVGVPTASAIARGGGGVVIANHLSYSVVGVR